MKLEFLSLCIIVLLVTAGCSSSSVMSDAELLDFKDHTADYKGKTLTMKVWAKVEQWKVMEADTVALFDAKGKTGDGSFSLKFRATIPRGLDVPRLTGEQAIVTFACTGGNISTGNVVKQLRRP